MSSFAFTGIAATNIQKLSPIKKNIRIRLISSPVSIKNKSSQLATLIFLPLLQNIHLLSKNTKFLNFHPKTLSPVHFSHLSLIINPKRAFSNETDSLISLGKNRELKNFVHRYCFFSPPSLK